jgi:nitroreductase
MDFRQLVAARYSSRNYESREVEPELLEQVLEAGRLAPTAANRQAFHIVVITDPDLRARMRAAYQREWFYTAPVILVACGIPARNWVRSDGKNYNDVDVAIVMDHLILQAADLGLGSCWIADFDRRAVCDILELPEGVEPVALTPIGYPADAGRPKKRRTIEDIATWNGYQTPTGG